MVSEFLAPRGSNLRNGERVGRTIKAVLRLVHGDLFDDEDWDKMEKSLSLGSLGLANFTRARYKLDIAHMMLRTKQWTERRRAGRHYAIQLCNSFKL